MTKKCTNCKSKTQNTATDLKEIPLIASECEAIRQHGVINRLIWVCVLLIVLLFGSNLAWTIYEHQFEVVEETYDIDLEQDTEYSNNNCVVNGGNVSNGTTDCKN